MCIAHIEKLVIQKYNIIEYIILVPAKCETNF